MMNRLKLGVMVCLAVFALVYVSEVRAVEIESLTGTWSAQGTWEGYGSWTDTWHITQNGNKVTIHSDGIDQNFKGKVKGSKISFKVKGGCEPKYKGTVSGDSSMSGTMKCTNEDVNGTWSATKTGEGQGSSGASAAGPGE